MRRRSVLIFPHVPKAGGTSLDRGLRVLFRPHFLRLTRGRSTLSALGDEQRANLAVITGHFRFDEAEKQLVPVIDKQPIYVGTVRDAVARARSLYSFVREKYADEGLRSQALGVPYDDDIDVVVRRWLDRELPVAANGQCRVVCGEPSAAAAIRCIEDRYVAVVTPPAVNSLLGAVARRLRRRIDKTYHLKNTGSGRYAISPGLVEELRRANAEDEALVEWVASNQDRMLRRVGGIVDEFVAASGLDLRRSRVRYYGGLLKSALSPFT